MKKLPRVIWIYTQLRSYTQRLENATDDIAVHVGFPGVSEHVRATG